MFPCVVLSIGNDADIQLKPAVIYGLNLRENYHSDPPGTIQELTKYENYMNIVGEPIYSQPLQDDFNLYLQLQYVH